jgi:hypothetical protein
MLDDNTKYILDKLDESTKYMMEKQEEKFDRIESKLDLKFNEVSKNMKEKQDKSYCVSCNTITYKKLIGSIVGVATVIIGVYEGLQKGGVL